MRNLVKLIIVMMLIVPLVSTAQESLGTFENGECIQLKQSCSNCSYINFTKVSYPNGSIALEEVESQKDGTSYNYTFCNTTENGIYLVEGIGDDGGTDTIFLYNLEVTPTGLDFTTKESITHFGLIFGLITVSIFFLIFSRTTESAGVKLFLSLISYLMMFLSVGAGYIMLQSVQTNMLPIINVALYTMGVILIVIMFYIFINLTKHAMNLMRMKKGFGSEYDDSATF